MHIDLLQELCNIIDGVDVFGLFGAFALIMGQITTLYIIFSMLREDKNNE